MISWKLRMILSLLQQSVIATSRLEDSAMILLMNGTCQIGKTVFFHVRFSSSLERSLRETRREEVELRRKVAASPGRVSEETHEVSLVLRFPFVTFKEFFTNWTWRDGNVIEVSVLPGLEERKSTWKAFEEDKFRLQLHQNITHNLCSKWLETHTHQKLRVDKQLCFNSQKATNSKNAPTRIVNNNCEYVWKNPNWGKLRRRRKLIGGEHLGNSRRCSRIRVIPFE